MTPSDLLASPQLYELSQYCSRGVNYAKKFFDEYLQPSSGDRILDIGCGTGLMYKYLRKFYPHLAFTYVGFDMSKPYIEYARRAYGTSATFYCEKLTAKTLGVGVFDKVIAAGVVHHLDDDESLALFRTAFAAMEDGGRLVTLDGCYRPGQARVVKWLLDHDRGNHVRTQDEYVFLANQVFQGVESHIRDDLFFIPYTNAVLVCTRHGDKATAVVGGARD